MSDGKKSPTQPSTPSAGIPSAAGSGSGGASSPHTPRGHVMFAAGSSIEHTPEEAASPRSLKILSRKKTPFAEDLKSSLAAFRSMDAAEQAKMADALLDAQQQVRDEEAERLKELPKSPPLPPKLEQTQPASTEKKQKKTVQIVSPPSAAEKRAAAAVAECDVKELAPVNPPNAKKDVLDNESTT